MADLEAHRQRFRLDGRVALVPGGAGGIGTAVCEALAAHGATVVVASRDASSAGAVAGAITSAGGKAEALALDPLETAAIAPAVGGIVERHGRLDVLVNCVGGHIEAPALEYREEDWDHILALNLKSAFFLSQAVAGVQVERGGGKHVHLSSLRGELGLRGRGYASYCASKGGLNLLVKQLASEWGTLGITVNAISPTFTRTELVRKYLDDPSFYDPLVARIPLGRVCEPDEVASLAVYLSGPGSDFMTGQILTLDGGISASQ